MFQGKGRERTRIQEYEGFQEVLRYLQAGGDGLILAVVDIGEDTSLRISLRRGSTTEVMNSGLDTLAIETNNRWINREGGRGGGEGLSMSATYNQAENALGMYLRYSQIM